MKLTKAQSDSLNAVRTRPDVFGSTNCYIKTKAGGDLILFKPNAVQKVLDAYFDICQERKKQFKVIILKARQFGVSTWGIKNQYTRVNFKKNFDTVFAAHDDDSTVKLFKRALLMQEKNPEKYPTKYISKREMMLEHQNSCMTIQTMGKGELGRSGVFNDVHLSELAFSEHAEKVLTSIAATLPKPHINHDVMYTIESTANGQGGSFYDLWTQSTPLFNENYCTMPRGEIDTVGIFFPWFVHPDNSLKAWKGLKETLTSFNDDTYGNELEIMDIYNLTLEQMAWRRWSIVNEYHKNLNKFNQENPANDTEAFLSTGRPVFAQNGLVYQRTHCRNMMYKCEFSIDGQMNKYDHSMIEIYEEVCEGAHYVMALDPAEGLDKEEKKDPDASSCHVIRVDTKSVVAKINTQADLSLVCAQVDQLGRYYNDAYFAFEINNTMGGAARQIFKNLEYPNMYKRHEANTITDEMTEVIGWRTDIATRGDLITKGQEVIRERIIRIISKETCDQMMYFTFNKNGRAEARAGEHDDDVMSLLIAIYLLLKLLDEGKHTEIIETPKPHFTDRLDYDGGLTFYTDTLAYDGAVDLMQDMEEDDEWV